MHNPAYIRSKYFNFDLYSKYLKICSAYISSLFISVYTSAFSRVPYRFLSLTSPRESRYISYCEINIILFNGQIQNVLILLVLSAYSSARALPVFPYQNELTRDALIEAATFHHHFVYLI